MDSNIAAFFNDPDASDVVTIKAQQIAAPVVRGQDLSVDEMMMGGGVRIVLFALDRSPSMKPVQDMLRDDFNDELVPAIHEAREDDISALRIGGISFSSDITSIWESVVDGEPCFYHALDALPKLTRVEYDPSRGYGTALHAALIDGTARAMKYASQLQDDTGVAPDVDIIVLTDGVNNDAPMDGSEVKRMIEGCDKTRVRFSYFFFETAWGLGGDPKTEAQKLGFDPENVQVFAKDPNETPVERRRRFRRLMRVMSRVSASKGMSAVKATAAVMADDDDDDLI